MDVQLTPPTLSYLFVRQGVLVNGNLVSPSEHTESGMKRSLDDEESSARTEAYPVCLETETHRQKVARSSN